MNRNQQNVSLCFPRLHFTSNPTEDEMTRVCMTTSSISLTGKHLSGNSNRKPFSLHVWLKEQLHKLHSYIEYVFLSKSCFSNL